MKNKRFLCAAMSAVMTISAAGIPVMSDAGLIQLAANAEDEEFDGYIVLENREYEGFIVDGLNYTNSGRYAVLSGAADKSVKEVTIPAKVNGMPVTANSAVFKDCPNLKCINVDKENTFLSSIDGILYNKSQTRLIECPTAYETSHFCPPETVEVICQRAFEGNTSLEYFNNSEHIKEIQTKAFKNCKSLKGFDNPIIFSSSDIIEGCTGLTSIIVSGKTTLHNVTLNGLTSLESFECEPDIMGNGRFTATNCPNLKFISFGNPEKAENSDEDYSEHETTSFFISELPKLEKIQFNQNFRYSGYIDIENCDALRSFEYPENTSLKESSLTNCDALESLDAGDIWKAAAARSDEHSFTVSECDSLKELNVYNDSGTVLNIYADKLPVLKDLIVRDVTDTYTYVSYCTELDKVYWPNYGIFVCKFNTCPKLKDLYWFDNQSEAPLIEEIMYLSNNELFNKYGLNIHGYASNKNAVEYFENNDISFTPLTFDDESMFSYQIESREAPYTPPVTTPSKSESGSGVFENGVKWSYNAEKRTATIYGNQTFMINDFEWLRKNYEIDKMFIGKDITCETVNYSFKENLSGDVAVIFGSNSKDHPINFVFIKDSIPYNQYMETRSFFIELFKDGGILTEEVIDRLMNGESVDIPTSAGVYLRPPVIVEPKVGGEFIDGTVFGDIDGNGEVDINDAVRIMSFTANAYKYPLTEEQKFTGDVYSTGDGISNMDALEVNKFLAGIN